MYMFSISDCHASGVHCQKEANRPAVQHNCFFSLADDGCRATSATCIGYDMEITGLNRSKKLQGLDVLSTTWRFNNRKIHLQNRSTNFKGCDYPSSSRGSFALVASEKRIGHTDLDAAKKSWSNANVQMNQLHIVSIDVKSYTVNVLKNVNNELNFHNVQNLGS